MWLPRSVLLGSHLINLTKGSKMDRVRHYRAQRRIRRIAYAFGVKLKICSSKNFLAEYECGSKTIRISLEEERDTFISMFFHELGHYVEHVFNKYKTFYHSKTPLYKMRLVALKAERSADKTGRRLCKIYFPDVKYESSYRTKDEIEFNREYYKDGRRK